MPIVVDDSDNEEDDYQENDLVFVNLLLWLFLRILDLQKRYYYRYNA